MKTEKLQQTTRNTKDHNRQETTRSDYMPIKWTTWKKRTNAQKSKTFQDSTRKK